MESLEKSLTREKVVDIVSRLDEKMDQLVNLKDFRKRDNMLTIYTEQIKEELPRELKEKFEKIQELNLELEDYYIAFAYLLGKEE